MRPLIVLNKQENENCKPMSGAWSINEQLYHTTRIKRLNWGHIDWTCRLCSCSFMSPSESVQSILLNWRWSLKISSVTRQKCKTERYRRLCLFHLMSWGETVPRERNVTRMEGKREKKKQSSWKLSMWSSQEIQEPCIWWNVRWVHHLLGHFSSQ